MSVDRTKSALKSRRARLARKAGGARLVEGETNETGARGGACPPNFELWDALFSPVPPFSLIAHSAKGRG